MNKREGVKILSQDKRSVGKNTYSAADVSEYLGISRVGAYNLMHSKGFPAFVVGKKRILVTKEAFEKWLQAQQGKEA